MKSRVVALGLFGWGLVLMTGPLNADGPDQNEERAERIRALQRQILDLENSGRVKVLQARGQKPPLRPAVNTVSNVESFAPVTARFVRFTVLATTNGAEPCLHTLEVIGADSTVSLTAASVRLTASSVAPAFRDHFKSGRYVQGWCWVSAERGTGWVQVELPAPARIGRVVWSRDAAGRHHDRIPSVYRVEASADGRAWQTVATDEGRAVWGQDYWVSRWALLKALDPAQRKERQGLVKELRKLGGLPPDAIRSGPQVGEALNGAFAARGMNGPLAGRSFCPV